MTFARPELLWWGVPLSLVPILLHLLQPRPRDRGPLPTARFLTRTSRRRVRVSPPDEWPLLALRCGGLLFLALGLAGPVVDWGRSGTATVILLDGGAGMAPVWTEALSLWREGGGQAGTVLVPPAPGEETGSGAADTRDGGDLQWQEGERVFSQLLRDLAKAAVQVPGVDSIRPVLVTFPRWSAWAGDEAEVRKAVWPGGVELRAPDPVEPRRGSRWRPGWSQDGGGWEGDTVELLIAAFEAAGRELASPGDRGLVLLPWGWTDASEPGELLQGVQAGDTLILLGQALPPPPLAEVWPWADAGTGPGRLEASGSSEAWLLTDPWGYPAPIPPVTPRGGPASGARVIAVGGSGRPLGASVAHGDGCLVHLAVPLLGREEPPDTWTFRIVQALAAGCVPGFGGDAAFPPEGWVQLSGEGAVQPTPWQELARAEGGIPGWVRFFLILALLSLVGERILAGRRLVRRSGGIGSLDGGEV